MKEESDPLAPARAALAVSKGGGFQALKKGYRLLKTGSAFVAWNEAKNQGIKPLEMEVFDSQKAMSPRHRGLPDPLWIIRVPMIVVFRPIAADNELLAEVAQVSLLGVHRRLFHLAGGHSREDVEGLDANRQGVRVGIQKAKTVKLL